MADTPNRYALPWTAMIGAMGLLLVVVLATWGFSRLGDDHHPTETVQYSGWLKTGRHDGRLRMFAPRPMPDGWRATSASYQSGAVPHWHLGILTADDDYVGLEESVDSVRSMVHKYVDKSATRGRPVRVDGHTWRSWHDPGGDYALARELPAPKGDEPETVLVVGSAPPAAIRGFVAVLSAH